MSDLISREEVLRAIITAGEVEPDLGYTHLYKVIENLPSAEPKKGRWIIVTIEEIPRYIGASIYIPVYRCSRCGMSTESYVRFDKPRMPEDADFPRYCPNCGVKMSEILTDSESEDKE